MTKQEKLDALIEIETLFDNLWGKCWDAAHIFEEEADPIMYEIFVELAIDSEERKNKLSQIISEQQ